ncbi:hypothetical protein U27_05692 [Candidatus Vecturithrix granuli]|uniref:Uncharacterized protein n=1 Tax=Vecturithrix granuli TaxID=1499967 RepID=A0A081C2B2_VECG1|nr:hypothetical protein U27_05692 [Candidatus Vecturithrix granuli]
MAQRINININIDGGSGEVGENDIRFRFKKGIFGDTLALKNISGKPFHDGKLDVGFDGKSKKKESFKVWRSNATKKYSFWFSKTPQKIYVDVSAEGVDIANEYHIKE